VAVALETEELQELQDLVAEEQEALHQCLALQRSETMELLTPEAVEVESVSDLVMEVEEETAAQV
tara:strand:+ start:512 stop:706 length:195 start_codon:yes stop_codon:yes gene_type:complete